VTDFLAGEIKRIVQTDDFQNRVSQSGATLFHLGPEELDKFTAQEVTRWTGIVRKLGITAQ
jgi:tripartite-type tricarboxylate transporter receptor subunit TctC